MELDKDLQEALGRLPGTAAVVPPSKSTSTVRLNGVDYVIDKNFVDNVVNRITTRVLRSRTENLPITQLSVTSELNRLYPNLRVKVWYKDFVVHFCKTRSIPCDERSL